MPLADWGKKLGSIAQNTVEKSKELSEITRLNLIISNSEGTIRNAQIKAGEYVMKNDLLRDDSFMAELYGEVDKDNEIIAANRAKIEAIKAAGICQNCGADIGKNVRFCSACGAEHKVTEPTAAPTATEAAAPKLHCAGCGAELEPGTLFCTSCGTKVEA